MYPRLYRLQEVTALINNENQVFPDSLLQGDISIIFPFCSSQSLPYKKA